MPGVSVRITDGDDSLPTEADRNTAGLAALHFFKLTGIRGGADIEIIKRMPVASGLGSSAASAASAAFGLNRLFETCLGEAELIEIASQGEVASGGTPHADNVSACLLGGFVFLEGRHPLRFDRIEVPEIPIVLRVQRKSLTTSRGMIPSDIPLPRVKEQMAWCAAVALAVHTGDIARIGAAINRDHISEPVRSGYIRNYADLKERTLAAGAWGMNVSGGGSSVFAIGPPDRLGDIVREMSATSEAGDASPQVLVTRASNRGIRAIDGL
jgi:homoserine kinase